MKAREQIGDLWDDYFRFVVICLKRNVQFLFFYNHGPFSGPTTEYAGN